VQLREGKKEKRQNKRVIKNKHNASFFARITNNFFAQRSACILSVD
jgi:hypothetical protein